MEISSDVVEQTEQALRNIDAALIEAGATVRDVVRVTYILPHAPDFQSTWPALKAYFGETGPASTMIQCGLASTEMKIEIEVTALRAGV